MMMMMSSERVTAREYYSHPASSRQRHVCIVCFLQGSISLYRHLFRNVEDTIPPAPIPSPIQDLCSFFIDARQGDRYSKMYISTLKGLRGCHRPQNASAVEFAGRFGFITLDQVLAGEGLTLNQRVVLSFILSSSLLQLHETSWLSYFWSKNDICFRSLGPSHSSPAPSLDVEHPFVKFTFPASIQREPSAHAKRQLLDLGIMLLEIWVQKKFEDVGSSTNTYGSRYDAARQWLDEAEVLPFYQDVVTRCIECSFTVSSTMPAWDDEVFRRAVCDGVLNPLWGQCSFSGENAAQNAAKSSSEPPRSEASTVADRSLGQQAI